MRIRGRLLRPRSSGRELRAGTTGRGEGDVRLPRRPAAVVAPAVPADVAQVSLGAPACAARRIDGGWIPAGPDGTTVVQPERYRSAWASRSWYAGLDAT